MMLQRTKTLLVTLAMVSAIVTAKEFDETCKCWDGYEQRNGTDGPECAGVLLRNILPCNVVRVPKCVCTGNASVVTTPGTGTWCNVVEDGKEIKKWDCENKEEREANKKQFAGVESSKVGL